MSIAESLPRPSARALDQFVDRTRIPPKEDAFSAAKAAALAAALRREIAGEVRFNHGDRALYATDASNYRQVPIGVVIPKSVDDVIATMSLCRKYGAPFLPRGGGTS